MTSQDVRWIQRFKHFEQAHAQLEKTVLYGSRAKGNYKTGSDIGLTLDGGADLYMPYHFDLSILKDILDHDVLNHIRRVGVVFYERNQETRINLWERNSPCLRGIRMMSQRDIDLVRMLTSKQ